MRAKSLQSHPTPGRLLSSDLFAVCDALIRLFAHLLGKFPEVDCWFRAHTHASF